MLVGALIERHALREVLSNRLRRMQNSRFRTDHGGASRGGVGTGGPSGRSGTTLGRRGERGVGPPRLLRAGADPWRGYRTGIAPATTGQSWSGRRGGDPRGRSLAGADDESTSGWPHSELYGRRRAHANV